MGNKTGAIFSEDKLYRYVLWRKWDTSKPCCLFICLNPSTADENTDDATIRRCKGFAEKFGYGGMYMTNLFAFRSTYPKDLYTAEFPLSFKNDAANDVYLLETAAKCDKIVFAWGGHGKFMKRDEAVIAMFPQAYCLGTTKNECPKHPLYLAKTTELEKFNFI